MLDETLTGPVLSGSILYDKERQYYYDLKSDLCAVLNKLGVNVSADCNMTTLDLIMSHYHNIPIAQRHLVRDVYIGSDYYEGLPTVLHTLWYGSEKNTMLFTLEELTQAS